MGLTPERIEGGVAANLVFCRLVPKRGAGRLWVEWVQLGRRRPIPVFSPIPVFRAFPEKTESRDSPAGTNRIQGSCWNGGQHGWRNRIRKICVRASLERDRMALLFRRLRSNLE